MTTLLLIRHGLTNQTGPVLSGWTPDLHLDDRGRQQVSTLAGRLAGLHVDAIVSSPLERCMETAATLAEGRDLEVAVDERFGEAHYGDWTGRPLRELAREPLWKVVQATPSAVVFPNGEAVRDVQLRALAAIRDWNARLAPNATWIACTHADVIKGVSVDALGMHLDQLQRIGVGPASVTAIRYAGPRPTLIRLNDVGGDLTDLRESPARRRRRAGT